jgi:predicted ATPase/DNA-binding XRE family transcriptional regulator
VETGGAETETQGSFGARLRTLREAAALSQEELATRARLTAHAVSALERGTRTRPYPNTIRALADALDASEEDRAALVAAVPSRRRGPDVRTDARPGRSGALPSPTTPLLARSDDAARVAALLRDPAHRIVTLTGTGGVGKTRLSIAAADAARAAFPDGVVFVELAPLLDPGLVLPAIGDALDATASEGSDARAVLAERLRNQRVLLVLDNFEHLLAAATDVARLAEACPGLTVLVSSRAALRVRGETEYAVEPLAVPHDDTPDAVAGSPSGALFLERARAVRPDLELSAGEMAAVAQICTRLAGLPLALELAAPWVRVLAPSALLSRLDQVASTDGSRDLPARQRTLRAALDWSFGLLDDPARRMLAMVSVFTGGFTLDDAECVAAHSGLLALDEVLNALTTLAEQSLIVATPAPGTRRYHMLEPVAQYARARLRETGEEGPVTGAHIRCFLDLAEQAAPEYQRAHQVAWLARVDTEHSNLTTALERALEAGRADDAGRIGWALWLYWWLRGHHLHGRILLEGILAHDLSPEVRTQVETAAACMAFAQDDVPAALAWWNSALSRARQSNDPLAQANAVSGVGLSALATGDLRLAESRFCEAHPLAEASGADGDWIAALTRIWLGTVLLLGGDAEQAVRHIESGLESARRRGDRLSIYIGLYNLSQVAAARDDTGLARTHLQEGIRLSTETQDLANLAYFLESLAVVDAAEGEHECVPLLFGAAQGIRESIGNRGYGYYQPDPDLARQAESAARARLGDDAYDDALDRGRSLDPENAAALAVHAAPGPQL